jgi:hypothetical protein
MNTNELRIQIKEYDDRIKKIKDKLYDIARNNSPHDMPKEYYEVKKEQQNLESERSIMIDELVKINKTNSKEPKKFVNSYGEATKRYITSTTYEKSLKRKYKDILRYMGE